MQTTEILSALAELSQRLYDEATEARREHDALRENGQYHKAALKSERIAALVEFDNALSRIITKAQKADVGQTLDGGSLQSTIDSLMEIVEGVRGQRWASNGVRLVDTREWCAFYVASRRYREEAATE